MIGCWKFSQKCLAFHFPSKLKGLHLLPTVILSYNPVQSMERLKDSVDNHPSVFYAIDFFLQFVTQCFHGKCQQRERKKEREREGEIERGSERQERKEEGGWRERKREMVSTSTCWSLIFKYFSLLFSIYHPEHTESKNKQMATQSSSRKHFFPLELTI